MRAREYAAQSGLVFSLLASSVFLERNKSYKISYINEFVNMSIITLFGDPLQNAYTNFNILEFIPFDFFLEDHKH